MAELFSSYTVANLEVTREQLRRIKEAFNSESININNNGVEFSHMDIISEEDMEVVMVENIHELRAFTVQE